MGPSFGHALAWCHGLQLSAHVLTTNAHLKQCGIVAMPDVDLRVFAATDDECLVAPGQWAVRGDAQDHDLLCPLSSTTPPSSRGGI